MANPQPTDAHIRIAHSITEAIMMRNFSKRQRAILDLILRLSWGCGKKSAIIPMKKDFRLVGVSETKITDELNWLVNARVIKWLKETNEFSFMKNFDLWAVSLVSGYDRKRFDELLHINLTSQNGNFIPESGADMTSQNGNKLPKKIRNFPKSREVEHALNGLNEKVNNTPKESTIKSKRDHYIKNFESLWVLFPRKEGKSTILKSTAKLKAIYDVGFERMKKAIENYKSVTKGRERQYIMQGGRFFGGAYIDYLPDNFEDEIQKQETGGPQYADLTGIGLDE